MTKEPFKIFSYNEYTLGEIGICREPHTIAEFNNVKAWDADVIVTMTQVEEFGIDNFKKIKSRPRGTPASPKGTPSIGRYY